MKTKKMIVFLVLFSTIGINAQTPVCKIDTSGLKRIPTILLDKNDNLTMGCRTTYNTNSKMKIWFDTCIKEQKSYYDQKQKTVLDLTKYNFIEILYGFDACDMNLNYSLYNDKSGQAILVVNLFVPEFRCKAFSDVYVDFLVLKKDCPNRPRVCILQHQIENQ